MFSIEITNALNEGKRSTAADVAASKARYWAAKGVEAGLKEALELLEEDIKQAQGRTPRPVVVRFLLQTKDILHNWLSLNGSQRGLVEDVVSVPGKEEA